MKSLSAATILVALATVIPTAALQEMAISRHKLADLSQLPPVSDVVPSADGRMVLIVVRDGIYAFSRLGGGIVRVAAGEFGNVAWSPKGDRIAFDREDTSGKTHVWTMRLDPSTARPLAQPEQLIAGGSDTPMFSRDGKWLAFARHHSSGQSLAVVAALGGQPRVVARTTGGVSPIGWSVGDRQLYYAAARAGFRQTWPIFRVAAEGGEPEPVIAFNLMSNAQLSFDGRFILYKARTDSFAIAGPDGRRIADVSLDDPNAGEITRGVRWMPASNALVFATRRRLRQIVAMDLDSGGGRPLSDSSARSIFPVVSPDGRWVAALTSTGGPLELTIRAVSGGSERTIRTPNPPYSTEVQWSPDGRYIAVPTGSIENPAHPNATGMTIVDVSRGVAVGVPTAPVVRHFTWTGDSRFVRYFQGGGVRQTGIGASDSLVRQLPAIGGEIGAAIFSDHDHVYVRGRGALIDLRTGGVRFLIDSADVRRITPPAWSGMPVFSPDGQWIAMAASSRGNGRHDRIIVISVATRERRVIEIPFTASVTRAGPVWHPRSTGIFAAGTARDGSLHVYSVDFRSGQTRPVADLDGAALMIGLAFSVTPDARTLVVSRQSAQEVSTLFDLDLESALPSRSGALRRDSEIGLGSTTTTPPLASVATSRTSGGRTSTERR